MNLLTVVAEMVVQETLSRSAADFCQQRDRPVERTEMTHQTHPAVQLLVFTGCPTADGRNG